MGTTQNMLAPHAPAALKAQNVAVAFSNMYMQGVYQGGAFRKELVQGWLRALLLLGTGLGVLCLVAYRRRRK